MTVSPGSSVEIGSVGAPYFDDGLPTAIVGQGRSLDGFDLNQLRGKAHVIAVKAAIFELPWADCGFGQDFPRLVEWRDRLDDPAITMPVYWAIHPQEWANSKLRKRPHPHSITYLRKPAGWKISADPSATHEGGTSGFGALNLGVLKRAKDIFLFGFDYNGPHKAIHRNGGHYIEPRQQQLVAWAIWAYHYRLVVEPLKALGVRVLNASPNSAITSFEKISLAQAVEHLDRARCP